MLCVNEFFCFSSVIPFSSATLSNTTFDSAKSDIVSNAFNISLTSLVAKTSLLAPTKILDVD